MTDIRVESLMEDKPYLYRMRKVKFKHRGFSKESKEKWKSYVGELHQEIKDTCRKELTDPGLVLNDAETFDVVARILDLPERTELQRDSMDDSSLETLFKKPMLQTEMSKHAKRSVKSIDFAPGSFAMDSSFFITSSIISQPSSSLIEFVQSEDGKTESAPKYSELPDLSMLEEDYNDDVYVNPPTPPPEEDMEPWVDKRSPYQKFFSLAEYKATRWRRGFSESKPKELLTVQEREEHLYNNIATDFCKWVGECQFKNVQLDETTVTELFQVGMETPAVKAMCVETKELPIVPAQVAQIFNMPEKSEMAGLRKQVQWDIKFANLKEKGTVDKPRWKSGQDSLGCRGRTQSDKSAVTKQPRSIETLNRWFSTNLLRKEEKTGEMLWAELEKTKVFKHFCNWMIDNEKYKRPQYLDNKGYFKAKSHIDESDMVRVVRMENETTPIESTVVSARNNLENLAASDATYGNILEELMQDIPSLRSFLGFDVAHKTKIAKDKKKKGEDWASPVKPLTEGIRDEGQDTTVHYMALINHPEWP